MTFILHSIQNHFRIDNSFDKWQSNGKIKNDKLLLLINFKSMPIDILWWAVAYAGGLGVQPPPLEPEKML